MNLDHLFYDPNELTAMPEGVELRSICESDGWQALCKRLQNNRPASHYLRIYRNPKTGMTQKSCNKYRNKPWDRQASWAWDTLNQTASTKTSIGFYSQSHRTGLTFWGAIDFDLHDDAENGEPARTAMYREALAAFQRLADQFPKAIVIFEDSGRGFHVWLIMEEQTPVSTMHDHMRNACCENMKVELIPSPRISAWGKPLRAPGTWNPEVDRVSMILGVAYPEGIIPGSRCWLAGSEALLPERSFFLSLFFRATKGGQPEKPEPRKPFLEAEAGRNPEQIWNDIQEPYLIELPNTRYNQLLKLVGECFYQYGTDVVLRLAELQFESKRVHTTATREEHIKEAEIAFKGMLNQWLKKQANPAEVLYHNNLRIVSRQDAFRILHNFAKAAEDRSDEEFFVSHKKLAERLQMSKSGAALILSSFEGTAIKMTSKETAKRARRYCWLLK